ncbi:MAG: ferredoxin--NADP reductase [Chloroflexi bacterium]|nr:ferredoxin--NADP reductase [Chloroflexota bacterium]
MVSTQESSRPVRRLQPQMATARIVERQNLTEDLWLIKLEPSIPFPFKPGQYCTIGAEDIERPYSIVSSPEEPLIELFVELVPPPDGQLTPVLYNLDVGAELTLRPKPKGIFTLDRTAKTHVFVSTVTGVAPTVSILRHALMTGEHGEREFHVLDGGSYVDELAYRDELQELADMYDFIHFTPTVSRPNDERNAGWTGATGRVNTLVEDYLQDNNIDPETSIVYACGHPGMIEDVKERMERVGYRFKEERFWKD